MKLSSKLVLLEAFKVDTVPRSAAAAIATAAAARGQVAGDFQKSQ